MAPNETELLPEMFGDGDTQAKTVTNNDYDHHHHHHHHRCDESKCVSSGRSELHGNSFTCYGGDENDVYPMMCADGYLPRIVEGETEAYPNPKSTFPMDGGVVVFVHSDVRLRYFTCCPPSLPTEEIVARHCSDPTATTITDIETTVDTLLAEDFLDDDAHANDNTTATATIQFCNDEDRSHYRPMKTRRNNNYYHINSDETSFVLDVDAHVCCDSALPGDGNNVDGNNVDGTAQDLESEQETEQEITGATVAVTNFLNETDCVPYHNEFYAESKVRNRYGRIAALTCDFPNGEYHMPRLLSEPQNPNSGYSYECCREGTGPVSPPFVRDSAFGLTIYPQIVLSSIAVLSSIVIIVGLSVPLIVQLCRRRSRQAAKQRVSATASVMGACASASASSSAFGMTLPHATAAAATATATASTTPTQQMRRLSNAQPAFGRLSKTASFRRPRNSELEGAPTTTTYYDSSVDFFLDSLRRKQKRSSSKFSTYNLYLVYLAIPDLVMNLYLIAMYSNYALNRTFHSSLCGFIVTEAGFGSHGSEADADADADIEAECIVSNPGEIEDGMLFTSILSGYWTANIYLNAIVAWEVFSLLKNSKNFQKHQPPSLRKVTLQATGVCTLSVLVTCGYYFLSLGIVRATEEGADDLSNALFLVQKVLLNALLLGFVPILFFPTICILIWRRGLMPKATTMTTTAAATAAATTAGGSSRFSFASTSTARVRDRALRELAWYFFRIVAVFGLSWIPIVVVSSAGGSIVSTSRFAITFLVLALQQIVSACASLTKSDVRKHIASVFCCCGCSYCSSGGWFRDDRSGNRRGYTEGAFAAFASNLASASTDPPRLSSSKSGASSLTLLSRGASSQASTSTTTAPKGTTTTTTTTTSSTLTSTEEITH